MQKMMWMFWVGMLVFAHSLADLVKGYEKGKRAWGRRFRYGLYMGVMLSVMHSFGWYVILPMPLALAFWWFVELW